MTDPKPEMITLTIDGVEVSVPKGTQSIRAAEAAGIAIPRFCDHPLLDPAGACRQCMVEIVDMGNGRGFPRPQPSCVTEAAPGMVLKSQATSEMAAKAQADVLELLLINHPLDCPICDKAGECPLQNQVLASGRGTTRFDGVKRSYAKPLPLSPLLLHDRERCVMCTRCTRFADQIAGDPSLSLQERGGHQQIGVYPDQPFDSYFSGNTVQICPVGALTSADYRFAARPCDLVSTVTTCENCAAGCQLRVDARSFEVRRRNAGDNPAVNEEWSCDRGRFGFVSARGQDRLTSPLIRQNGRLIKVSWPEALAAAADGLKAAGSSVGVLTGGRLTLETAYAYSRFARTVCQTNSIDFRSRPSSAEEAGFLARQVAGQKLRTSVTYADLEKAKRVVLVMFEPEDEAPMVFLRLRKAVRKRGLVVTTIAPILSRGSAKLAAEIILTKPGEVPLAIRDLEVDADTIILVGERMAQIPGGFNALMKKLETSSCRLAWIPRRAGEVGAVEAGCLPGLLPGGYPLADEAARAQVGRIWGVKLDSKPGLDGVEQIEAAARGDLKALVTSGIEANDWLDPAQVLQAAERAFTVSLETRMSEVAALADVVLPVDLLERMEGSFLNWEHRPCPVVPTVGNPRTPMTEIRVLVALAQAMGAELGFRNAVSAGESLAEFPVWDGPPLPIVPPAPAVQVPLGAVVVATWRELLDDSRCLDGADALRATARTAAARLSPQTVRTEGLATSSYVRLTGPKGSVTFPIQVEPAMADNVIWVPTQAAGALLSQTGLTIGDPVTLAAAPGPKKEGEE